MEIIDTSEKDSSICKVFLEEKRDNKMNEEEEQFKLLQKQ